MEEEEAKRDRISEMPEEIKEQIVSSLCMKDAIRTSSLSSVWRYSWVSLPFLDFGSDFYKQFTSYFKTLPISHPKKYIERQEVGYLQMLDEFWQVYIKKNPSFRGLKKISLYVPPMLSEHMNKIRDYASLVVSRCLSLAKNNVTELDYWIHYYGRPFALRNCLPILESKTLTKLKLNGCYLATLKKVDIPIDLPNLKHLRLIEFNVGENMLETLLAKCPALEKLKFLLCEGFKVLRIPRVSKLKEVKVMDIYDLHLVEINAMSLQWLTLANLNTDKCKVKMASNSCNKLVKLFVDGCGITDDFFNNVAEFHAHLETVSLKRCPELKHIKITGNSLTSLDIKKCPNLSQAQVDTPKPSFTGYSSSSKNIIKRLFPKS